MRLYPVCHRERRALPRLTWSWKLLSGCAAFSCAARLCSSGGPHPAPRRELGGAAGRKEVCNAHTAARQRGGQLLEPKNHWKDSERGICNFILNLVTQYFSGEILVILLMLRLAASLLWERWRKALWPHFGVTPWQGCTPSVLLPLTRNWAAQRRWSKA